MFASLKFRCAAAYAAADHSQVGGRRFGFQQIEHRPVCSVPIHRKTEIAFLNKDNSGMSKRQLYSFSG